MDCPCCRKSLGGPSTEGGQRIRLAITLVDQDTGRIHGPCPFCKSDVTIAHGSDLVKALRRPEPIRPGRRRRVVRLGLPITRESS